MFFDTAKAFEHCEICLEYMHRDSTSLKGYVFFFNAFVFNINQAWELLCQELINRNVVDSVAMGFVREISDKRNFKSNNADPLLVYLKEARNQLSHRESILWISSDEKKVDGLGKLVNMGQNHEVTSRKLYSRVVLPSLSSIFVDTFIALKPVRTRDNTLIPVPASCMGHSVTTTPFDVAYTSYDFYGQQFDKLADYLRKKEK